jgi:peptidoglycan DL-endopeptidase CwlO
MTIGSSLLSCRYRCVLAAVLSVALCLASGAPAAAEPTPPVVPDAGVRPPSAGAAANGGSSPAASAASPVLGPLAQQIRAETLAVQALEQQFTQLDAEVTSLGQDVASKRRAWDAAIEELERATEQADENAAAAYKAARGLGPLGEHADQLRLFGLVMPSLEQVPGTGAYGRELSRAQAAEQAKRTAFETADEALRSATARRDQAKAAYDAKKAFLADLIARNAAQLSTAQAQLDAYEGAAGAQLGAGEQVAGMVADPRALAAVRHALRQLGKPYEWAAEGPNSYDCSGLVWDAYRTVGITLPRVAAYQYNATTKIQVNALLPGDLLFFGPPGHWTGIGHMGMYIGNGKMVQAPTTGDVVKISTPRWSNFYGATRVIPAVRGPAPPTQPPTTAPSPSPSPSPSPTRSTAPSPSTRPSTSTSPSPSRSPSPAAAPSSSAPRSPSAPAAAGASSSGTGP